MFNDQGPTTFLRELFGIWLVGDLLIIEYN